MLGSLLLLCKILDVSSMSKPRASSLPLSGKGAGSGGRVPWSPLALSPPSSPGWERDVAEDEPGWEALPGVCRSRSPDARSQVIVPWEDTKGFQVLRPHPHPVVFLQEHFQFGGMCALPVAAVTNDQLGGLQQQEVILSRFCSQGGTEGTSVPGLSPGFWGWPLGPLAGRCVAPISASVVTRPLPVSSLLVS